MNKTQRPKWSISMIWFPLFILSKKKNGNVFPHFENNWEHCDVNGKAPMHTSCKRRPGGWVLDPNLVKKNLIIHGQSAIHSKAHNVFWNMAHPSNLSSRSFPDPSFRPLSFVYFLINLDIKVMRAIWLWIFLGKIQKKLGWPLLSKNNNNDDQISNNNI